MIRIFKESSTFLLITSTSSSIKLVISCLINGLVHEESEDIYAVLDNMNVEDMDERNYKKWLIFKNISREIKFGFTIGGFAPLRKTTLIPVL